MLAGPPEGQRGGGGEAAVGEGPGAAVGEEALREPDGNPMAALGVVSVLASLDIPVTVLLARFVLSERPPRLQSLGVAPSVVGVVLVPSG